MSKKPQKWDKRMLGTLPELPHSKNRLKVRRLVYLPASLPACASVSQLASQQLVSQSVSHSFIHLVSRSVSQFVVKMSVSSRQSKCVIVYLFICRYV